MPLPDPAAYYGAEDAARAQLSAQPPQHVLDQLGGSYDQSRYYWNPDTFSLVDRTTGGSYGFDRADPANGTDVITNYGNADQNTLHYGPGQTPYFGFGDSARGYNGGDAPNSGMFVSADPNAIGDYQSHRQDVVNRGVAQVGALVGGAALGGALSNPGVTTASQSYTAPTAVSAAGQTAGAGAGLSAADYVGMMDASVPAGGAAASGFLPKVGNFLSKYGDYVIPAVNGALGAYASGKASDAETAALQASIDETRRQYDTSRSDLMPWLTAGQGALNKLNNPTTNFMASPDYAFRRAEGERDIGNSFAARGGAASGNALRALTEYNSALASGEYGDWWNRQAGLAGVGQTTGMQLGTLGANSANNVGNYLAGQGVSRASGVLGKYGSIGNAINDSYYNRLYRRG